MFNISQANRKKINWKLKRIKAFFLDSFIQNNNKACSLSIFPEIYGSWYIFMTGCIMFKEYSYHYFLRSTAVFISLSSYHVDVKENVISSVWAMVSAKFTNIWCSSVVYSMSHIDFYFTSCIFFCYLLCYWVFVWLLLT